MGGRDPIMARHFRWQSNDAPQCLNVTNDLWIADGYFGGTHSRPVQQSYGGTDCTAVGWYNTSRFWIDFRPLVSADEAKWRRPTDCPTIQHVCPCACLGDHTCASTE